MKLSKSWSEVTIAQFQKLNEAFKYEGDLIDKQVKILSALSDKDEDFFASKIPFKKLPVLIKQTEFVYTEKPKKGIRLKHRIKGRYFRINPNVSELSAANYIDLTTYVKDEGSTLKNLHNIMAIFFTEVSFWGKTKPVTIKSQIEKGEFLKNNLTMDWVQSYSVFFLTLYKKLINSTEGYLSKERLRMRKKLKQLNKVLSENIGVGL